MEQFKNSKDGNGRDPKPIEIQVDTVLLEGKWEDRQRRNAQHA